MSKFYANFNIYFEFIYKSYNIYIKIFIYEEEVKREKSNEPYFNTVLSSEENDNENFDKNLNCIITNKKIYK